MNWKDQLGHRFGGAEVWRSVRTHTNAYSSDSGETYVDCLWRGTWSPPAPRTCSYCGTNMEFHLFDAKRPIPAGARDMGLTDPAVAWRCPACENVADQSWLTKYSWAVKAFMLCPACCLPFRSGQEVAVHAQFKGSWHTSGWKTHEGDDELLGDSAYHPGCLPAALRQRPPDPPDDRPWDVKLGDLSNDLTAYGCVLALLCGVIAGIIWLVKWLIR